MEVKVSATPGNEPHALFIVVNLACLKEFQRIPLDLFLGDPLYFLATTTDAVPCLATWMVALPCDEETAAS